ncbi:MAG: galactokinase [Lentisphaeria bacterium]|jgi:galactokinase
MTLEIRRGFQAIFHAEPEVISRAPGRLEILGNHTDYNEGVVLSVAVDRANTFAARAVAGTECTVHDLQSREVRRFAVTNVGPAKPRDWANYIKGIVVELQKRGVAVPAFQAAILGNVPLSAGMSSSAAFEMAVALTLTRLAKAELPWLELAKAGQACENHYVGAKTGLLDQFSSLKGQADMLVFSDFRSHEVHNTPLPHGVALVVANCMVKHHLTNEYNDRRADCEAAAEALRAKYPGVKTLRDVSMAQLEAAAAALERRVYLRAKHVVGECERVYAGCRALEAGDIQAFGRLMFESHESSRVNFENSCAELDILVELAKSLPGCLGARLSGGGFGGITVNLVEAGEAERFAARLGEAYKLRSGQRSDILICHAAAGARVLQG